MDNGTKVCHFLQGIKSPELEAVSNDIPTAYHILTPFSTDVFIVNRAITYYEHFLYSAIYLEPSTHTRIPSPTKVSPMKRTFSHRFQLTFYFCIYTIHYIHNLSFSQIFLLLVYIIFILISLNLRFWTNARIWTRDLDSMTWILYHHQEFSHNMIRQFHSAT